MALQERRGWCRGVCVGVPVDKRRSHCFCLACIDLHLVWATKAAAAGPDYPRLPEHLVHRLHASANLGLHVLVARSATGLRTDRVAVQLVPHGIALPLRHSVQVVCGRMRRRRRTGGRGGDARAKPAVVKGGDLVARRHGCGIRGHRLRSRASVGAHRIDRRGARVQDVGPALPVDPVEFATEAKHGGVRQDVIWVGTKRVGVLALTRIARACVVAVLPVGSKDDERRGSAALERARASDRDAAVRTVGVVGVQRADV